MQVLTLSHSSVTIPSTKITKTRSVDLIDTLATDGAWDRTACLPHKETGSKVGTRDRGLPSQGVGLPSQGAQLQARRRDC
jgi:hypothetical protein